MISSYWSSATRRFTISLVAAMAAAGQPARAAECLFKGEGADTRVAGTGVMLTPFPEPMRRPDCELLRVVTGSVRVVTLSSDRARLVGRKIQQGPLAPRDAGTNTGTDNASDGVLGQIGRQLSIVISGDQRLRTGSSRSGIATVDYPADALPRGRVALPRSDLLVPLGPVPDPSLRRFEVVAAGRTLHRQDGPATALLIPAQVLAVGQTFRWTLVYGSGDTQANGEFTVDPPHVFAEMRAALEMQYSAESDPMIRQLNIAAALEAQGYGWDARPLVPAALMR